MRKLPIDIQGLQGLRNDGYLYVDKTEYVYSAGADREKVFPESSEQFGKRLLLSAMK